MASKEEVKERRHDATFYQLSWHHFPCTLQNICCPKSDKHNFALLLWMAAQLLLPHFLVFLPRLRGSSEVMESIESLRAISGGVFKMDGLGFVV